MVDPSHSIDKTPHTKKRQRKEGASENDIPHPIVSTYSLEETGRDVASNAGSEGIQQDGSGVHSMMSVHIKHAQQSHDNDGNRQGKKLAPIACKVWTE